MASLLIPSNLMHHLRTCRVPALRRLMSMSPGRTGSCVQNVGMCYCTSAAESRCSARKDSIFHHLRPQSAARDLLVSRGVSLSTSAHAASPGSVTVDTENEDDKDNVFHDPRIAILDASLNHVHQHGFSAVALAAGAKDCGFHSVAAGMFPGGEADLVRHVMSKALQEVKSLSQSRVEPGHKDDGNVSSTEAPRGAGEEVAWDDTEGTSIKRLRAGIQAAISAIKPYQTQWAQAMAIGALPHNAGAISTALAILADELAFLSGDRSTDLSWYGKRVLIAGIYASSELFMLTDESEGMKDTWEFLDRRLADYETLCSAPESAADVLTGVGTVATSLSSAILSLGGPILRQASKQVPGGQTLADVAPTAVALASEALSLIASHLPYGIPNLDSMSNKNDSAGVEAAGEGQDGARKFSGAPERDPWSESRDASSSSSRNSESGTVTFEEELAREEEELFGKQGAGGKNGAKDNN